MDNIYFIADTHFNHANVIKYCNRPYKDADQMNRDLIKRWNNTVASDDKVFMLGDFAMGSKDAVANLVQQLHGRKTLILGNHDRWNPAVYMRLGFQEVSRYPILWNDFFILSHAPKLTNINSPFFNIYGHVHNNPNFQDYTVNSFCCSVERIGYTPISFQQIQERIKNGK